MGKTRRIAGLDIGTTKICAFVAELNGGTVPRIVGFGQAPSEGMRRGVVVDLEKTVAAIETAVAEAEQQAGCPVREVVAGIAGDHIRSINSRGVVAVARRDNEITQQDVARALEQARAMAIPVDREIIHAIPQQYIVDDQDGVRDPLGMTGVRLEAHVHVITGAVTAARNIVKGISRAGLKVRDLVLEPLASSHATLEPDEKQMGALLMDVGGGTTDVALFYEGGIRHTAILPLGGANVTNDIAIGLRTPFDKAEELKIRHGCALASQVDPSEVVRVPGVGGREAREVGRQVLASMIEPRMEEIFSMALKEVRRNAYFEVVGAGVVLTGGTSLLPGAAELAAQIFQLPVRVGCPRGVEGLPEQASDPRFATGVGLLLHALQEEPEEVPGRLGPRFSGIRQWLVDLVS
ncbi:MAG TPA: cell division protein FtsA [Candidatus Saccharimonadales bacterium]|nr:cell division protein FtsA [Candidatus Saccharimonadales bacterium]